MSNVARLREAREQPEPVKLGAATVTSVAPGAPLEVRLGDGTLRRARLAMPLPYDAREGDEVLVIGGPDGHFVIGVLSGSGRTNLEFQGDVRIRAVQGDLSLCADKSVRVEAPEISVVGRKVGMMADAVVQRFVSLRQRVASLLDVHAGESRTAVDGTAYTSARSATLLTQESVVINGKAVHLG